MKGNISALRDEIENRMNDEKGLKFRPLTTTHIVDCPCSLVFDGWDLEIIGDNVNGLPTQIKYPVLGNIKIDSIDFNMCDIVFNKTKSALGYVFSPNYVKDFYPMPRFGNDICELEKLLSVHGIVYYKEESEFDGTYYIRIESFGGETLEIYDVIMDDKLRYYYIDEHDNQHAGSIDSVYVHNHFIQINNGRLSIGVYTEEVE